MDMAAKYDESTLEWLEQKTLMNILERNPSQWSGTHRKLLLENGLLRRMHRGPNGRFELTEKGLKLREDARVSEQP